MPAAAQSGDRQVVHLPSQRLSKSLQELGQAYHRSVSADDAEIGQRIAPALDGEFSFDDAISALLAGSGLSASPQGDGMVVGSSAARGADEGSIVVTGSRIRGAPVASTTLRYDRETARNAGQSTPADVIRAIPQNFGGGQNAGIGSNVPNSKGADVGGGSSINLRGLGSDATLTLLDGHRLSYDAALQSVDVPAIPFGAIDRIEIVPDGSSALFGSDAVAGVANIILRRGFQGLETSARIAGSTDGGNFQQQYGATLGQVWSSGSGMISYEYARTTPIDADQRSYARDDAPGVTLFPYLRHHNLAATFEEQVVPDLTFDMGGLYNIRWRKSVLPLDATGDRSVSRYDEDHRSESWGVTPSLTLSLPADWEVTLGGSYGWNKVSYVGTFVYGASEIDAGSGAYRNRTGNIELSGNGKLFDGPGGPVKLALGGGYRENRFSRNDTGGASSHVDESQSSRYVFGEFSIPVFAPEQASPLGRSLDFSLAARHERYPGVGSVTTPKLGVIYSPTGDVTLRGSWGRSFRAPTLYEQYTPASAYLVNASAFGAAGPPGATAILISGGNPQLKPERAVNWSASLELHPRALAGARLQLTYFDIRYRDRIVTPILYTSQALSNPLYAAHVTTDPSAAEQAQAIGRAVDFVDGTGRGYDPASVIAIVDNSNVNAGKQRARGVDVLGSYSFRTGRGTTSLSVNASYLDSKQQLGAGQPVTQLAGSIFNPPHFRGRGEAGWSNDAFTATLAVNYIGPVRDVRLSPAPRIDGMLPVDLTVRYRTGEEAGLLGGLDLIASAQNLFNDKPSSIQVRSIFDSPYDSTNYSPFGRVLSLTISKRW
ncbi:outer membrane receptor for ferrienterochelin and colicin [Novosphingobium sp. PhB55]|uniref:TonB-dependent receptor n=1 Tax=Novosphingobium sp. PhB55 TaxID=2485106 RepID=UPI0010E56067|nr:TonB-dependent receptor [Novosphingobium sp. PhB55]TDW61555.1 outer membrane receptor for ferrienterochelin and colicin [Novosphingobium sp. PhB55]